VNIKIRICQIIGPAGAGSAGPVPTALFKVIDVGISGKLVSSACYDAQQVCVYLQPFSR